METRLSVEYFLHVWSSKSTGIRKTADTRSVVKKSMFRSFFACEKIAISREFLPSARSQTSTDNNGDKVVLAWGRRPWSQPVYDAQRFKIISGVILGFRCSPTSRKNLTVKDGQSENVFSGRAGRAPAPWIHLACSNNIVSPFGLTQ